VNAVIEAVHTAPNVPILVLPVKVAEKKFLSVATTIKVVLPPERSGDGSDKKVRRGLYLQVVVPEFALNISRDADGRPLSAPTNTWYWG
jgi:hypothetical protein